MERGLLRETVTPVRSGVQLPAALKAPHCTAAYNRGLSVSVRGSGIPLSQLCLIPSLPLLREKTKLDPQPPDEKEMDLTLVHVAEPQGCFSLTGDQVAPALFFSTATFLEEDCYDCIFSY